MYTVNYTKSRSAMPYSVASTEGAIPSMAFDFPSQDWKEAYRLHRTEVDGVYLSELTDADYTISVSGLDELRVLNSEQFIPHSRGGVPDHLSSRPTVSKITSSSDIKDPDLKILPAFVDNGWLKLKEFASAFKITLTNMLATSSHNKNITDLRHNGVKSRTISFAEEEPADVVKLHHYEYVDHTTRYVEIFPKYSEDLEPPVISADAGETVEVDIPLNFSVTSLHPDKPKALEWVSNKEYQTPVFSVIGNDDLPLKPAMFSDYGGSLDVHVSPKDPRNLTVTFTGPALEDLSPFTVAMSSGDGANYTSLHVVGRGVGIIPHVSEVSTGVENPPVTPREQTVDNPFVCTPTAIANARIDVARAFSGLVQTATFSVLDQEGAPEIGESIRYNGVMWRVDSIEESAEGLELGCSEHTTIADVDTMLRGAGVTTIAQFNASTPADVTASTPIGLIYG